MARQARNTIRDFGMGHKAKLRCGEGKGHLLNIYCVRVIPVPTPLVAEYFYFHCTEEDTKARTGTGYA